MDSQSIKREINQCLERFSQAAQGLFEVTARYITAYEQDYYGCIVAKPSRRMKASLGVDREILAVVSTFVDQQQRTIKFVEHEIGASQGRYENSIAIIMHKDPDGDAKLKNWGSPQTGVGGLRRDRRVGEGCWQRGWPRN